MQTVKIETHGRHENSKSGFPVLTTLQEAKKKNPEQLTIHGYKLRNWLDSLKDSNGIYYLDLDVAGFQQYSMHYCDHVNEKVLELDYCAEPKDVVDERKEFLESLIFDLSLFPNEPILVFNRVEIEACLNKLSAIYYENTAAVDAIISRMTSLDMQEVFKGGIYHDSEIKVFTVDAIYHSLYPGTSRTFAKAQGSYGMHLIILAVQSILYQIAGKKMAA